MGIKIRQESKEMVPRSVPKVILEASRFQEKPEGGHPWSFLESFGATWAILGVILGPAGRQGALKIELFWHQIALKFQK